jgi:thioredoxin-like negative regulator of GroEL
MLIKKKHITLLLLSVIMTTLLYSQYDHKRVIMNQIRRLEARREFAQTLPMYEDLLETYPEDEDVITGYFNTLINLDRIDDAAELLDKYEPVLTPDSYTRHRIIVLIRQGKRKEAGDLGLNFLRRNEGVVNLYRDFAFVYERQREFDTAVVILLKGREVTNDDYLFAIELARNYDNLTRYPDSIREYIKHLERNSGFLYFVTNRIKAILDEDSKQIDTIKDLLAATENDILAELYALSLAHTGDYQEALIVYQKLDPEKLNKFADELHKGGDIELARQAYQKYRETINDPAKSADVAIKIALLYIGENDLQKAKNVLAEITEDKRIQNRQVRFRTRANRQARELLAEIAVRLDKPQELILGLYDEAKEFAFNRNEQKEVDLKKVHYLTMSEDYEHARSLLQSILKDEQSGSQIANYSYYYVFMLELMSEKNPSDSLLAELIINIPGSDLTNEALFLTVLFHEMNPNVRDPFLKAYRQKSIYKDNMALETLLAIDEALVDEEIMIISGQWALEMGNTELAGQLFSHPFQNDTLAGYAALQLAEISRREEKNYREILTAFLSQHPLHVFSPKLRLLLTSE